MSDADEVVAFMWLEDVRRQERADGGAGYPSWD